MLLGIDVGGTFTDFFVLHDDGSITAHKRPSTPAEPAAAVLAGLDELAGITRMDQHAEVVHGSTVATNAIIERKGARTALITTRGFRDVLLIGRQNRPRLYDLAPRREPPLVPDDLRLEAKERIDKDGNILEPLVEREIDVMLDRLTESGVESLAVCFLFSFLKPEHELLVGRAAERRGIPVSMSHEILPEHREYERAATTVANAYVAPLVTGYLTRLRDQLATRSIGRLRIMSSSGGSISPESAGRHSVRTAVSGPAGGVIGAFSLARAAGIENIITLDMGGTSTDVALCPGGIVYRDETHVGSFPVRGPTVNVLSVGAGGGSIARIDAGGALRVGPESAGANPGPACYGVGVEPTVTDAQVALGRIAPEFFLAGQMDIRPDLSVEALATIAQPYEGDPYRAAAAVLRVANANMERALRVVSVERGHDPRDFTLVPFGGAGPLHACDLAATLGIRSILVPRYPGILSALGMATAAIVKDISGAVMETIAPDGAATYIGKLPGVLTDLERRARSELAAEGLDASAADVSRTLEMRYKGQSYELPVDIDAPDPRVFLPAFHAVHRQRYGHGDVTRPVEVVTARVRVSIPGRPLPEPAVRASRRPPAALATRHVYFPGPRRIRRLATPFYAREALRPGASLAGPAVVVQMDSTVAVPPGWSAAVDKRLNLILTPTSPRP